MPTILQENTKILREAMSVICGIDETTDKPTNTAVTYCYNSYKPNAKVTDITKRVILMDLCNGGFVNDGQARPVSSGTIEGKYGYISSTTADSNGDISSAPVLTISAANDWDYITLILSDSKGNIETRLVESPVWSGGDTTVTFNEWTANERLHIERVALGKAWQFDNETLISCTVSLRGVETKADNPELQLSEIEIKAYEPTSYVDVIGRITAGAPIWYQAGYPGDYSAIRHFYLNDTVDWEDNILTIRGYDASYLLDKEYGGKYTAGSTSDVAQNYFDTLADVLTKAGVNYTTVGSVPAGSGASTSNVFVAAASGRSIIANAMNLYRDNSVLGINYVDAGIPTLYAGAITRNTWSLNADQIADFKSQIELNIDEISATLQTAAVSSAYEDITQIEVVAGETYFINSSEPCTAFSTTSGTIAYVTPYTAKLTATATTTATVRGKKIVLSATASNDPFTVSNTEGGTDITLDTQLLLPIDGDYYTQMAMADLLGRSNITFEYTYRGNPRIQPRDIINLTLLDGSSETMTVDTVTLEHSDGGLKSKITARRGVI